MNVQGFLIDPNEWDEDYAIFKARELANTRPSQRETLADNQVLALGI